MLRLFIPIALAMAFAHSAAAQVVVNRPSTPVGGESPTRGVRVPAPVLTGNGSAAAIEFNPAAMTSVGPWNITLHQVEFHPKSRVQGTGTGLFAAAALPILDQIYAGFGFQWVRPSDPIGYDDTVKLSFALATHFRRMLSLGVSLNALISDQDSEIGGMVSLDAGLTFTPFEWLGLGFAVQNINTPVYDGIPLEREYAFEVVGRPLRSRRLSLGLGFRISERRGRFDPQFRLAGDVIPGLRLFSHLEILDRDFYRDGGRETDYRVTAGLQVDFESISIGLSTLFGRSMPAGRGPFGSGATRSAIQGGSIAIQVHGANQRPIGVIGKRLIAINLRGDVDQYRMVRIYNAFREIEERSDIGAILLQLDGLSIGWAQSQELRTWIKRLRRKGKRIYSYLKTANTKQYYIAAAGDKVLLDKHGGIRMQGLAAQRTYLRGLFDLLGVKAEFIKIAEYKSAPEQYTRKGPTDAARAVRKAIIDDVWAQLLGDVARDRGLTPASVSAAIDRGPFIPPEALKEKLVDQLIEPDEMRKKVQALAKMPWSSADVLNWDRGRWPVGPKIAVVVLEGDIVGGSSSTVPILDRKLVGDRTIIAAIDAARRDSRVKAIVLRINSPGGSALASAQMWRQIRKVAKTKPVIVSMADIAASGGYFAAATGRQIYASPATITGSIGIFTGKFDLSKLLATVGITTSNEVRGKRAMMDSMTRGFTDDERKFILSRLRYYYNDFIDAVGENRKMSRSQVDKVARGRVWTGSQALKVKLVDKIGGLADAIEAAQQAAGLTGRPRISVFPKPQTSLLGYVLKLVGLSQAKADQIAKLPATLKQAFLRLPIFVWYAKSGDPLARLPYELTID